MEKIQDDMYTWYVVHSRELQYNDVSKFKIKKIKTLDEEITIQLFPVVYIGIGEIKKAIV